MQCFHRVHQQRYGYADERKPVEVVNVRLRATAPGDAIKLPVFALRDDDASQALLETRSMIFSGTKQPGKVYDRELLGPGNRIGGPALIVEYSATTVVAPGWTAHVDACKNLVMEVTQ